MSKKTKSKFTAIVRTTYRLGKRIKKTTEIPIEVDFDDLCRFIPYRGHFATQKEQRADLETAVFDEYVMQTRVSDEVVNKKDLWAAYHAWKAENE